MFDSKLTGNVQPWELDAHIVALENIEVAAGEHEAFKIKFKGWFYNELQRGRPNRASLTYWYSPAVRESIRRDYDDVSQKNSVQLIAYPLQQ